nr:MAG TPA: hypothetical protein [Caudoviricetes sp.]
MSALQQKSSEKQEPRSCFPLHATPKLKALYGLLPMSC